MGARGPAPKRPDKRHGHRSKAQSITTEVPGAATEQPPLNSDEHPLAADLYAALADGAEARFYTPAMWQRARIAVHMLSGVLSSARPSSTMYAAIQTDLKALLVDAAEMRRLGVTISEPPMRDDNVIDWRARVDQADRRARVLRDDQAGPT